MSLLPNKTSNHPGRRVGKLVFDYVTPGVDYHAAFVSGRARPYTPLHTHDFYEMFYVLEGTATHTLNDQATILDAGDLVLIYPDDRHSIAGKTFHLINVAFPAAPWECFCALAGLEETGLVSASPVPPPIARIPSDRRQECAGIFGRILYAFQQPRRGRPARLELCWFWSAVLEFLLPPDREIADQSERSPVWLSHACRAMHEEENLRVGLERFVEVSGVSRAHLTRTLKAYCGQTPTEFLNEVRLRRAAMLLATTPADIIDIAIECGFDNLSYFYRRFRRQFGKSPRAWRLESQCIVMPLRQ
jgi:AraC-like DNA-binding protein/quercetin dioxygenase-like cupin family protein